jgi:hypothetical protein
LTVNLDNYRIIEAGVGALMASILVYGHTQSWSRSGMLQTAGSLGFIWVTLFGPATESATYILLCATAAQSVLAVTGRPLIERIIVRGAYALMVSMPVALWMPPPLSEPWRSQAPQAHGALILFSWIVFDAFRRESKTGLSSNQSGMSSGIDEDRPERHARAA